MFTSPEMFLGKRANKTYSDLKGWNNIVFNLVTSRIDKEVFSVLYKSAYIGTHNASVRVRVTISIFKEGFGCSDENLFEKVEFDLLVHKAFELVNLNDVAPSIDTYYLFPSRLSDYAEESALTLWKNISKASSASR